MNRSHQPRKRFGQHFLTEPQYVQQVVDAIAPAAGDRLVEIGPGQGAITIPLAEYGCELHAIEFDRDLAALLNTRFAGSEHVTIHEADALTFDFAALGRGLRVLGNLPYNISTPLMFRLLEFNSCIGDMHFMLQKEVVQRMCATPGGRQYGRLTIMLGSLVEMVPLFDVPPQAFTPPPRVTSSVVRMRPLPLAAREVHDRDRLGGLVTMAFSKRRKTLRNALKGVVTDAELAAAGIDPGSRPEQVAVRNWIALANALAAKAD